MKKTTLGLAISLSLASAGDVTAASVEDRLEEMEKRLRQLEQRVASQEQIIREKDQQISELTDKGESPDAGVNEKISIGGVIEVEANHVDSDGADDESDIYVATVELGISAQINQWTAAEVVLLYENDDSDEHNGEIDVDVAAITLADPASSWFVTAGKYTLPFGNFSTNLVSDPITLDAAETADAAIEFGIETGGLLASVYAFQGDQDEAIENFGFQLGYTHKTDSFAFSGNIGWLNDLAESDAVVDDATTMTNEASAWTLFALLEAGNFTFIGEYVAANEALDAYSASDEPSFFNIEAGYGFMALGRPASFAIGYQGSDEAGSYAGGLDEKRSLAAFSVEIKQDTILSVEYARAEDYLGVETDTLTGQLAVGF